MKKDLSIFVLIGLVGLQARAETKVTTADRADAHVHGSHIECPLPKNTMDVIRCAREQSPIIQRVMLSLDQAKGLTDMAAQFKNPDLEVESINGSINGNKQVDNKIALLVPIEIGGKRSARKAEAASEIKVVDAELYDAQADVTIETILKLHRLSQLEQEKSVLAESIGTFNQIITQQKSRPGLSPEQRTSISVFRMALAEAKIRQSELFEEEKAIEHYFHITTGHSLNELSAILPKAPKAWPTVRMPNQNSISPGAQKAHAEVELAMARLEAAKAQTWPELKVGPMMSQRQDGTSSGSIFGFQLSMGLPVFSLNQGGRNYAALGEKKAARGLELTQAEETHERAEQVKVYERVVEILKESPPSETIEKEHSLQKNDAKRGLISPALVIESHRQIEELTRSRHGRELKALESLWRIHKFDGLILQENL